jgi:hypothetical protein
VNLYIHNILAAVKLADSFPSSVLNQPKQESGKQKEVLKIREETRPDPSQTIWMTAEESLAIRQKKKSQEESQDAQYDLSEFFQAKYTKRKD